MILADYLIGAMDGFSPFKQDLIFGRLAQHLAPKGVLYIIGLEPIPYSADGPGNLMVGTTTFTHVRTEPLFVRILRCVEYQPQGGIKLPTTRRLRLRDSETRVSCSRDTGATVNTR